MHGPHVRRIANVAFEERDLAGRIDRAPSTIGAPGRSLSNAASSSCIQIPRFQMLDDAGPQTNLKRSVRLGAQVGERIGGDRVKPVRPLFHHCGVHIDAADGDAVLAKQLEGFAAAAAEVEHVSPTIPDP